MRKLLIDADVIAYQCSAALETAVEFEKGYWTWHVGFDEVCTAADRAIEQLMDELKGDEVALCLTDGDHNFRLDVLPTYKGQRASIKRPLVLKHVKQWMVDERDGIVRAGLEGDDVMGILATRKYKGEQIIVSIDKDMKTIPCNYVRTIPTKDAEGVLLSGAMEVQEITEEYADWWHLMQTLMGDTVDGYKGCPQIGAKKADGLLDISATIADNWAAVVAAYDKAGLGEQEALRQARVARILRSSDYNFKTKEPILWTP